MNIRLMTMEDYENVYGLWMSCTGMGLNNLDDIVYRNKAITEMVRIDT